MRANQGVYFLILLNLVSLLSERLRDANRLNDKHLEKIMELEDLLVGHTGKTPRELKRGGKDLLARGSGRFCRPPLPFCGAVLYL